MIKVWSWNFFIQKVIISLYASALPALKRSFSQKDIREIYCSAPFPFPPPTFLERREGKPHCPCIQAHFEARVKSISFPSSSEACLPSISHVQYGFYHINKIYLKHNTYLFKHVFTFLTTWLLEKYLVNLEEEDEEKRKRGGEGETDWLTTTQSQGRESEPPPSQKIYSRIDPPPLLPGPPLFCAAESAAWFWMHK